MLQGKGFRLLADSEKLPIPYQGPGVMAKRSFIHAAPATLENVLRALLIARHLSAIRKIRRKSPKRSPARCASNGSKTPSDGYQSMVNLYERALYPSVEGIRNVILCLALAPVQRSSSSP